MVVKMRAIVLHRSLSIGSSGHRKDPPVLRYPKVVLARPNLDRAESKWNHCFCENSIFYTGRSGFRAGAGVEECCAAAVSRSGTRGGTSGKKRVRIKKWQRPDTNKNQAE